MKGHTLEWEQKQQVKVVPQEVTSKTHVSSNKELTQVKLKNP